VCYHRVVENFDRSRRGAIPSMLISTTMLERHIDWMARRYSFVSLDELGRSLESGRTFSKPVAAITFDDGYSDVYHHAFPLLKRKGIPAAVFVVTSLIGTGQPQIFDRFYLLLRLIYIHGAPLVPTVTGLLRSRGLDTTAVERLGPLESVPVSVMTAVLNSLPGEQIELVLEALEKDVSVTRDQLEEIAPLTWDMVETMHRNGITIGSHTMSHRLLTSENIETAQTELAGSKVELEWRLNARIDHFAYPDGRFNPAVVQAVKSADYRYAYGICQSRDSRFPLLTIPRKVLWERSCLNVLGRFSPSIMNCHSRWVFDSNLCSEHDHKEKHGTIA